MQRLHEYFSAYDDGEDGEEFSGLPLSIERSIKGFECLAEEHDASILFYVLRNFSPLDDLTSLGCAPASTIGRRSIRI